MKHIIYICLLLIVMSSCSRKNEYHISYEVSPKLENDTALLTIKMSFKAGEHGKTILLFQDQAWGQDSLYNVIHNMKFLSGATEIEKQKDSGWIVIHHAKDLKKIDFEYTLQQDTKGDLKTRKTYRPIIQPEYFHIYAHNFFMLPKHILEQSKDNFDVTIEWKDFPKSYVFQNSFGSNKKLQNISNLKEEDLHSAIFMGGDFRVHEIDIEKNKVAFAIRGNWKVFQDSTMVKILKKTVDVQRTFWKDHSQEYFSVSLIPVVEKHGSSFQGTGLTNSFATCASNNENLKVEGLVYLFNHELQHNWTGKIIKNADEEAQYWFSEGFTEYYTIKNIAKHKIYNLNGSYFIKEFNSFIRALYTSPVKEAPNKEINYDNFWSNPDYQKLPYRRGALFAFYLDYIIQKDTNGANSLDDVMLVFKEDAKTKGQKIDHNYFVEVVNKFTKEDIQPFFNTHIEEGKLIDLNKLYDGLGLEYNATSKVFDLGFTFSKDRKEIAEINENSEAYKAGLRKGDQLISRSYYLDDTSHEAKFTIMHNGEEIKVSYLPVKDAAIPQLKDTKYNIEKLGF